MPQDPADPALMARLRALLHDAGGTRPLEARLAELREAAGPGPLGDLIDAFAQAQAAEALAARVALARAQHRLARLEAPPPEPGARLTGEPRAVGRMLARALDRMPGWRARGVFDEAAYLEANPDVAAAGARALKHYIASGAAEGRLPGGLTAVDPDLYTPWQLFGPGSIDAFLAGTEPLYPHELRPVLREEALAAVRAARPRISVIVPCWNRAHVVAGAVHAALTQSYAAHEVIAIDDGSTDGSADLLAARFAGPLETGQLRLIRRDHAGVSAARNAGLAAATGEIVAYLDSDNLWEADHLLYLGAVFATDPAADCAYTAVLRHNLDDGWSDVLFRPFDRAALERENYIDLNGFAHRRALSDRLGGFDETLDRLVDWDLVLRLTEPAPPRAVPVIGAHHVISAPLLGNITATRDAEANAARIRAALAARKDAPGGG
ncbi:glycosyltransferase family 2 protein [Aestuariicoccus sp. MJ-SS9]|uniref:glycosyltransferase family 2 protein n=1 Tax=Aestuariicoccus sp. MJ-SS9 TaxID=3079855 RepID=UPI00290D8142|nr:glycosyltransferase [Aestuariicoccus sp. MJ-SS9]MDU8912135.1 glycosyltransferase [Aestuariicoccus sp. MJ-SS9]